MKTVFIQGFGGIGKGLYEQLIEEFHVVIAARNAPEEHIINHPKTTFLSWDCEQPDILAASVETLKELAPDIQLVINTQGVLQSDAPHSSFIQPKTNPTPAIAPERRVEALTPENMLHVYYVNSVIPMITVQALWPILRKSSFCWVVNISAKVGSIQDNGLGGWYSYRSSKAALNMLTKTLALEFTQRRIPGGTLAIHPGTVATDLSTPFTSPKSDNRLSPSQSAAAILKVIRARDAKDSGTFWSYNGEELPW